MANIGAIIGGGFGLIRRHPGPVLVWGAISAVSGVAIGWVQWRLGVPASDEASAASLLGRGALGTLLGLLSLVISTVLSAAAFRAVLRPQAGGFAFLRLGRDEARMIGLTLLLYVITIVVGIVGAAGFAFLVALIGFVTGSQTAAQTLASLLVLAGLGALIFVFVRLSLVYPLVLLRRRITIDDSWEATRGHFWSLLGTYILLALISFALVMLVMLPVAGVHVQQMASGGMRSWSTMQPFDIRGLAALAPGALLGLAASVAVNTLLLALWSGALATAARDLAEAEDEPQVIEEEGHY
ncbi:hypothetical protein ACMGDH_04425 [Sphingomonas sp. DT-207]|uniref:hypothetical protein n=1 Tax=Sphingomonas sp. DT-207 TaxID=3396167 RepID=UPI003F1DDFDE